MKIKTLEFLVSNYVGNKSFVSGCCIRDNDSNYQRPKYDQQNTVYSPISVDLELNNFCKDKDIIDIKINTYTIHRHNNARCDSVIVRYTIMYR